MVHHRCRRCLPCRHRRSPEVTADNVDAPFARPNPVLIAVGRSIAAVAGDLSLHARRPRVGHVSVTILVNRHTCQTLDRFAVDTIP